MRLLPIPPRAHGPLVFVIDNHEDSRELLRHWFELAGFHVAVFADGCHAVDDVLRSQPDVIVMDGRLPHQDGWSVARQGSRPAPEGALLTTESEGRTVMPLKHERQQIVHASRSAEYGRYPRSGGGTGVREMPEGMSR